MTATSSYLKSLFEIKWFEGSEFDLWKERLLGILFLKDYEEALLEIKLWRYDRFSIDETK